MMNLIHLAHSNEPSNVINRRLSHFQSLCSVELQSL